jgi:hypothetical protein
MLRWAIVDEPVLQGYTFRAKLPGAHGPEIPQEADPISPDLDHGDECSNPAAALESSGSTSGENKHTRGRQTSPPPWMMDDKIDLSWLLHPLSVSAEAHDD